MGIISLKTKEDEFDFPENILELGDLSPDEDFKNNPIFWEIYTNIHLKNSNQIILFNGLPRTGKSEACLDFAYNLDRDPYTGDRRFNLKTVYYTLKDYLKGIKENNVPGQAMIWEEAGLAEYGANARDFFSKESKNASTIFQSMGFKKHLNLVNLPMKMMLDKQVRSLVHWIVTTEKINSRNECVAKIYKTSLKAINDEVWNTKYRFYDRFGVVKVVNKIKIPRAPKDIRLEYKHISDEFKQEIQERISQDNDSWRKVPYLDSENEINKTKLYNYLKDNMLKFIDVKNQKISDDAFVVHENVADNLVRKVKPIIRIFNIELKSGLIKPSSDVKEAFEKYKTQKTIEKEEILVEKRKSKFKKQSNFALAQRNIGGVVNG